MFSNTCTLVHLATNKTPSNCNTCHKLTHNEHQEIGVLIWPTYYTPKLVLPIKKYTFTVQDILQVATKKCAHDTAKCDSVIGIIPIELGRCSNF